ncbi:helix-turn-helix domain-containing protein [Parablautia muri]|uniref:XRE family transcriptional regulator n=1 Tax=Parablautia muri TaxID=2320879 RepID=A0A9X5BDI3_9FIRM|nr:helix-turn-helix transcriptional regulator [Parablautia muri]NBJ91633.1 XRE family transcriptional regulator [Parablautia muri]
MTKTNFKILKENIRRLMEENNVTQEKLGEIIDMSQSNVNKCLNPKDVSRCFSFKQICKIADYFEQSIDELAGRSQTAPSPSPKSICDFFMKLISHYSIVHFDHEVTERVEVCYSIDDEHFEDKKVKYDAFYFPNYIYAPPYFDEFRLEELNNEVRVDGNELHDNIKINQFLQKFIDAFEKRDSGVYDEETYNILVEAYQKILNK